MDWLIPGLVYSMLVSVFLYFFFCRMSTESFSWGGGVVYALFYAGLAFCEAQGWIQSLVYILLGILLLAIVGTFFHRIDFYKSFAISSLVISIYGMIEGILQSVTYWILSGIKSELLLQYADWIRNVIVLVLLVVVFRLVNKSFSEGIQNNQFAMLPILVIPVLFISLMESFISDSVYGNTVIWDTTSGLVFPQINNIELLTLQVFACGGLLSTLFAYQKLGKTLQHEQAIRLLEQQSHNQEIYIREAQGRYEQTRSFRHDITNHFLVLHQLLIQGKSDEANEYLEKLDKISDDLSFPVKTGNTAVDALLSSKLAIASQNGIQVHCSVDIPRKSQISDIDWCIVLSNAIDNAIHACQEISNKEKWIQIEGKQKGCFYLLNVENACRANTSHPVDGIGLTNIKSVVQKYNGTSEIEIADGVFKLNALFILPQQLQDIPQQSY